MKLLKVFIYHQSHIVFLTFDESYRYLCHQYKSMPYMFRSDCPFKIKHIHLYVDDHDGPHYEAVMAHELCIAIDKNRFTVCLSTA